MSKRSIGYHTRRRGTDEKIVAGTYGFTHPNQYFDPETVDRLVDAHFSVIVAEGGYPLFVDHEGRQVNLYIRVDPEFTRKGSEFMKGWRKQKAEEEREKEERREAQNEELLHLVHALGFDEALRRLKGGA